MTVPPGDDTPRWPTPREFWSDPNCPKCGGTCGGCECERCHDEWTQWASRPVGDDTPAPTAPQGNGWCIDAEGDAFYWWVLPEEQGGPRPVYPEFDGVAPKAAWRDLNEAVRQYLNRAGATPDLTAFPTAATVARYIDPKKLAWLRSDAIQIVLDGVVAALVRSAQNDTDGGGDE